MKRSRQNKLHGGAALVRVVQVGLVLAVVLSLLVEAAPALAADPTDPPPGGSSGKIIQALTAIAKWFIGLLIGIASILMAVGIVTGFVGGQFMVTVGNPLGLSAAWMRVISVVLLGVLAILGVLISNEIIDMINAMGTSSDIHVITP
jgi:hypothetical protein